MSLLGAVWLILFLYLFPWLGLCIADDAIERRIDPGSLRRVAAVDVLPIVSALRDRAGPLPFLKIPHDAPPRVSSGCHPAWSRFAHAT